MAEQRTMRWRVRTLIGGALVVCAWAIPDPGLAAETTAPSPMEILKQAPTYRVDEQGRLEPAAPNATLAEPSPAGLTPPVRQARPTPLAPGPMAPGARRPLATPFAPVPSTPIPIATFEPSSVDGEKSPSVEIDERPPAGLKPRRPEPTHKPGLVRGIMGKVPLVDRIPVIGPAITGKHRPERTPRPEPEPNPDILPSSEPLLYPPPAESADGRATTAGMAAFPPVPDAQPIDSPTGSAPARSSYAPHAPAPTPTLYAPPRVSPTPAPPASQPTKEPALADITPASSARTPAATVIAPPAVPDRIVVEPSRTPPPVAFSTPAPTPIAPRHRWQQPWSPRPPRSIPWTPRCPIRRSSPTS